MSEILVVTETEVLVVEDVITETLTETETEVLVEETVVTELLETAEQGPPGPQGIQGPAGGVTTVTVGSSPISGHSAVAVDAAGLLVPADSTDLTHRGAVLGLTENAYTAGQQAEVRTAFVVEHSGWAWTAGPVFVGADGALVQSLPLGAVFSQAIGQALSATRILVDVQPPITIA